MLDRFERFSYAISEITRWWRKLALVENDRAALIKKSRKTPYIPAQKNDPSGSFFCVSDRTLSSSFATDSGHFLLNNTKKLTLRSAFLHLSDFFCQFNKSLSKLYCFKRAFGKGKLGGLSVFNTAYEICKLAHIAVSAVAGNTH